jgi:predicted DNA-binding protein (MmcQ/YjbR family)
MVSIEGFRVFVSFLPEALEAPHFDKTSFRIKTKIFASYDASKHQACLKLSEKDLVVFSSIDKTVIYPVANKWGKQGWTIVEMNNVHPDVFRDILLTSYCQVAPKKLGDPMKPKNEK